MERAARAPNIPADGSRLSGLLASVADGDQRALADLYSSTSARLYGICLKVLRADAEAEEALQESYLTIWRRASAYDPAKASAMTWLSVLARNKAIDRLRARRGGDSRGLEAAYEIADDAPSALDLIESAQDRDRLAGCLEALEDPQRGAIRTAFFEGLAYSELAERQGVPLGTMKSWIRRGLVRLKDCLEQ